MAYAVQHLPVAMPGVGAVRTRGDQRFVGLKEAFMVSRFEAGRARFWTHGRGWDCGRGAVVLHQPGDVYRELERDGMVTLQIVRLPAALVGDVRLQSCLVAGDARAAPFHRLHAAIAAGADRFTLECVVTEAIGAMAALGDARTEPTRPVRRALALIRERWSEAITLDELARHARLDKFHLCRAFRAQVGLPPYAYLTQLRIMHAKALLAAGARPIDIAHRVGLYDQSQLTRHFRRIVGVTPGEFARTV
jgi:AraC-like DNA-binding protein